MYPSVTALANDTLAVYRRLSSVVFFNLTAMELRSTALGVCIGGALAYALYHTVPAYQAFINWQLQLIGF